MIRSARRVVAAVESVPERGLPRRRDPSRCVVPRRHLLPAAAPYDDEQAGRGDQDRADERDVRPAAEIGAAGQSRISQRPAASDGAGRVVASLVATRWEAIGEEWPGGPWLVDLFAVPGAPLLLGRSLLTRAVAVVALDGHDAVGLTVSATNRARRLYERLGFRDAFYRVTLDLPGAWPGEHEGRAGP